MLPSEEKIVIARRANEAFEQTAANHTLVELYDRSWPELYKISSLLHDYSKHIGYPQLIINPTDTERSGQVLDKDEPEEYTSIKLGRDTKFPNVYLWQVAMRQDSEGAILHGRSSRAGEDWQYIKMDAQHAKSSVYLRNPARLATNFILRSLVESSTLDVVSKVFSSHTGGDEDSRLKSINIDKIDSVRREKIKLPGKKDRYAFRQLDENDLPGWIIGMLAQPIKRIIIPHTQAT